MRKNILLMAAGMIAVSFISLPKQKDNTLSKKEKKEGWVLLFDGETTKGWRNYKNREADGWAIANGELYCKETGVNKRADLITVDQYENYELQIDWKISPKHNSGIIYMVTEDNGASYESGPEYQLIDDLGYPDKLSDKQLSGANYDMQAPAARVSKPAGEFNHAKIVVNKGHVEHWLNGEKILEFEAWTDEWNKKKMGGKWKDYPGYGVAKSGKIALQDHGNKAYFKNIILTEL